MPEPMIFANLLHLSYNMWGDWENPAVKGKYWTARPYLRFDEKLWNDRLLRNRDGRKRASVCSSRRSNSAYRRSDRHR